MPTIYHITTRSSWEAAKKKGYYESPSLAEEGYIHCSLDQQIQGVLERYFKGQTDLVKLVVDTDKLTSQFIYDWSMTVADTFPHVYGPINLDAVTDVKPV